MATAWDQRSDVISTSNKLQLPGEPASYIVPRPVGVDPTDVTSFHAGQAGWSPTNLPSILYELNPPAEWHEFRKWPLPAPKRYENGEVVYEKWPKDPTKPEVLLDIPHLPDQIGSQEWWWVFEAWRRYDPRIRWKDFMMRIHGPSRPSTHNVIQMTTSRNRTSWGMIGWFPNTLHNNDNGAHDKALSLLSAEQIENNTSRGTTPGLIDPMLGETGGRVLVPNPTKRQSKRRGQRTPGRARGGGNHQPRYKDKPKVLQSQKRKVGFEDLGPSKAPKVARVGSFGLVPTNSDLYGNYAATSEASFPQTISSHRPALNLGVCDDYSRYTTADYAETPKPIPLPSSHHIDIITNVPSQSLAKNINTPTRAQRLMLDGANSSGATIIHYEPSLSDDEELNFNDYVNASDTVSEGEGIAALNGSDPTGESTTEARPLQYGWPVAAETITSVLASSPGHGVDQSQDQAQGGKPHCGVLDLPQWYDDRFDNLDTFALKQGNPEALSLQSTDPTLSSFLDWENPEFED